MKVNSYFNENYINAIQARFFKMICCCMVSTLVVPSVFAKKSLVNEANLILTCNKHKRHKNFAQWLHFYRHIYLLF